MWNIDKGEAVNVINCHRDTIQSMSLNRDGSLLATTCKDKELRVIEPRSGIVKSVRENNFKIIFKLLFEAAIYLA